jgi:hypothetical protein
MCFVRISKETAIISLYSFNQLGFIIHTQCVDCEVRTDFIIHGNLLLKNFRCSTQNVSTTKQRIETHNASVLRIFSPFSYVGLTYFKKSSVYLFFQESIGFCCWIPLPSEKVFFFLPVKVSLCLNCVLSWSHSLCALHTNFVKYRVFSPQTQQLYSNESLYFFLNSGTVFRHYRRIAKSDY